MSKHTPGPWLAQEDCRGRYSGTLPGAGDSLPHGTLAYGIYGPHSRIAVLEQSQDWRSQETIDADARLMADAPHLLNALKELHLRARQFISGELVTFPAALLPQVAACIRHAEGGAE